MKPKEFKEQNCVLGKPKEMTDEECAPLPVFRDGKNCISCWELSEEELEMIIKTKCVYAGILSGQTQPPIFLSVEPPFTYVPDPRMN